MARQPKTPKTPADNTPVDAKRIAAMASAIYTTCRDVSGELAAQDAAKDALDAAKDTTIGKREQIMIAIAKLSHDDAWTLKEIALAGTDAGKMHNDLTTKKAMETFINEVKHAAHPLVRDHIGALVSIRNAAWAEETAQLDIDKSFPAPMRKCFKRKYHALIGAMIATENGEVFDTTEDLVGYARAHDPSDNARAVFKKIEGIIAELSGMYVKFPADDLGHAAEILGKLTWNELAAAQMERNEEINPVITTTTTTATPANNVVVMQPSPTETQVIATAFQSPATIVNLPTSNAHRDTKNPNLDTELDQLLDGSPLLAQNAN